MIMDNEPAGQPSPDGIVDEVSCPACAAPKGVGCYTPINGHDTGWTHDARVFKALGVRG